MKKLFTLIAMALMAVSVNAKEAIDFTKIAGFTYGTSFTLGSWDWKGVVLAEGEPVQNTEAKTADDSNVKYFDASAFDYVVVKYSNSTADISLIAQYKCLGTIGQWGTEFSQAQSTISASAEGGYAALPLDADQKSTINQIAIQGGNNGGAITIDEVYFATADEWEAVKPAPAQTKDLLASFGGTTNEDGSKTFVNANAWGWNAVWLGSFDASEFDYLVVELAEAAPVVVQAVIQHANNVADVSGQIQPGELMMKVPLDATGKSAISQIALQNGDPGDFTVKAVFFATQEYVDNMAVVTPDKIDLSLTDLGSGWNSEYAADTKTITITGENGEGNGGKGWWLTSADYSYLNNAVVEFEPTNAGGTVVVEYATEGVANDEVTFYPGATCVVVPLNAEYSGGVKQIYVMGDAGAVYTLTAAYVAKTEVTPTANIGTAPATETWTVAGNFLGSSWNPSDADNDMTLDGALYTLVKREVTLEKGVNYEFKVVKDHAWDEAYPQDNYVFTVEETAIYTVTVKFNADSKEITVNTEKTGEAQAVEHAYSVIGSFKNDGWQTDNDMTKGEDGIYTVTIEGVDAGNWAFKVRVDHDWSISYPSSDYQVTVEENGSNVVITFNEETKEVIATVTAATGINAAVANKTQNGVRYNLAGQKVSANYKGVVIQNGKKIVVK